MSDPFRCPNCETVEAIKPVDETLWSFECQGCGEICTLHVSKRFTGGIGLI